MNDIPDAFLHRHGKAQFLNWLGNTCHDLHTAKQLMKLWRERNQDHFTADEWLTVKAAIEVKDV